MTEKQTWVFRSGRRFGISLAQVATVADLIFEGKDVLVLSVNHQALLDDCRIVCQRLLRRRSSGDFPENTRLQFLEDRILNETLGSEARFLNQAIEPLRQMRGRRWDRMIVTGKHDNQNVEMFKQEYFASHAPESWADVDYVDPVPKPIYGPFKSLNEE